MLVLFVATGSVLSANIGAGQVNTSNIAPGAVTISTTEVIGPNTFLFPGHVADTVATCPPGTIVTGGGHTFEQSTGAILVSPLQVVRSFQNTQNGWDVSVYAPISGGTFAATATCATIHP